ncbi:MAG: ROK family transcriptional regulator [Xanthomonadales bacterium]|nr:ROK family transcriptional regulator [Xanthomonadales bacterium]
MAVYLEGHGEPRFFYANGTRPPNSSERRILGTVVRSGVISQSALARTTGLAQQSISRLVKGLVTMGAVAEGDRVLSGKRGQPGVSIRLVPEFAYTIGVSIMTEAISVILMDFSGSVLDEQHCHLPAMTRNAVLDRTEAIVDEFVFNHSIDLQRVLGMGVGISGRYIGPGAMYNTPHALDDWALVAIDRLFEERFDMPVWVENDGNAAAVGESLVGVGRQYDNFAYLFIDALLGGGIIIDHELMRGCNGNGGEIGLLLPKNIYQHPCLESLRQTLGEYGTHFSDVSTMIENFDIEWRGIDEWITKTQSSFSLLASALAAILDPEAIVLGGRLPAVLARKVIPHIDIYNDSRRGKPRALPRLLISKAGGDATAIGAASLPFKEHFFAAAA